MTSLACVLGDSDLLRALGLAGIPCVVAAAPGEPARYSRFARAVLDWADAWERPEELLQLLERFAAAQDTPPVLFYEEDRELLLISRYRERLSRHFRFVVPDPVLVEDLVDKGRFQALARRLDLPVPAARVLNPSVDPVPLDLQFPIALKPIVRRGDQWTPIGGAAKALRLDTLLALVSYWPRLVTARMPVLLQQLIPGPETCIESYHVYVDAHGETVGEFTGRKIRTWPPAYGDSTALEITDAPEVTALGRDLVRRLGLRGVAKFDFKRAPDGRLYLLEVNPRFTLWHHLGARAGVNIPALVYADLAGLPRAHGQTARAGMRWCKPWGDVVAARAAGIPFLKWLPWALSCEVNRVVAWDDPMPFVRGVLWRVQSRVFRSRPGAPLPRQEMRPAS
ncbi:MAG: ATP-grasp domain-containing protein [Gemmatimonadetes bacterium]|nr:MAG: ATP-grasp domain-containing protein [Gemmatimonadota bacterium]